jgi:capsular exopolysaccharide synthesis family protein
MNEQQPLVTHDRPAWTARFFAKVHRYRNLIRTRWWVLVICVGLALAAAAAYFRQAAPLFVSVGQMIVSVKLNVQQGSFFTEDFNNFLGTQAALMQGTEVINRAHDRLASQNPKLPAQPVTLVVNVVPKTTIFLLRATGENPEYTKKFLQACMEEYIGLKKEMVTHTSDTTIAALTDQMLQLEPVIQKSGDAVAAYLATNDAALLQEASAVQTYLASLYQQVAVVQSEYVMLQSLSLDQDILLEQNQSPILNLAMGSPAPGNLTTGNGASVNNGLSGQSPSFGANTIGMEYLTIKQQILLAKADQERFGKYLKPKHPEMIALSRQLDRLEQMSAIYRDQNRDEVEAQKLALTLSITNLQNQAVDWGKQNLVLMRKSAQYDRLKAKTERLQALYDSLLGTMESLDVNKDLSPETVTIYEPASEAAPDTTLVTKGFILAGVLGLALGVIVLLLMDRVDDRMNTFTELEGLFDEEILGQIPRERKNMKGGAMQFVQPDDERHSFVESYRNLRSSLLYMAQTGTRPHTLLVTSSVPNDGKSITAANLAVILAMGGSRVLLVDADLRKGNLHGRFNLKAGTGLSEVLSQNTDWRPAVQETPVPNLRLFPRGGTTQRASELFIGPVMERFLQEASKEYDYVLIDTAPVMAADDVTSLAPRVDGVVFVIRAEFTSSRVARAALDMLYQRKTRILGLVFNCVRATTGDYYYYHRYKDYYHK